MNTLHPNLHPRRALGAAVAAMALTLALLLPAAIGNLDFSFGGADRSAPAKAPVSAPATNAGEPAWRDNPFAWPLLQVPRAK
jgi:hypothetical protein